jgi:hypothetical protein
MIKTVIARMKAWNVEKHKDSEGKQVGEQVTLHPVYSSDPESPNYSFSKATPSGQVGMYISNPDVFGFFELHQEYDITFNRTPE